MVEQRSLSLSKTFFPLLKRDFVCTVMIADQGSAKNLARNIQLFYFCKENLQLSIFVIKASEPRQARV
jgi:hypothetical protein